MLKVNLPILKIGQHVARIPIIQGGMGIGISLSGLASAVANEGGIGVIAAAGIDLLQKKNKKNHQDVLVDEIRQARKKTDGIIGVNIMAALSNFNELVLESVNEKIDIIFTGAGLFNKLPEQLSIKKLKDSSTSIVPIVSSAKAAELIFKHWAKRYNYIPDAVVVEGPLAGGHLGYKKENLNDNEFKLETILNSVINAVKPFSFNFNKEIPVIAAGGIYTGEDIHKFLKMGAGGVQMGTRFVTTQECDADDQFKQIYINCKKEDLTIINSPVGLPGRAINNSFLVDVQKGMKKPFKCLWRCLKSCNIKKAPYCIAKSLLNARIGNIKDGFAFAGTNAYLSKKIITVKELIKTLVNEYEDYVKIKKTKKVLTV